MHHYQYRCPDDLRAAVDAMLKRRAGGKGLSWQAWVQACVDSALAWDAAHPATSPPAPATAPPRASVQAQRATTAIARKGKGETPTAPADETPGAKFRRTRGLPDLPEGVQIGTAGCLNEHKVKVWLNPPCVVGCLVDSRDDSG